MKKNTAFKLNNLEELERFYEDHAIDFWISDFQKIQTFFRAGNIFAKDNFGAIVLVKENDLGTHEVVSNPYESKPTENINVIHEQVEAEKQSVESAESDFKDIKNLLTMIGLPIPSDYVIEAIIDASQIESYNTENILKFIQKHK